MEMLAVTRRKKRKNPLKIEIAVFFLFCGRGYLIMQMPLFYKVYLNYCTKQKINSILAKNSVITEQSPNKRPKN